MQIRPATRDDTAAIAAVQTASWKDAYRGILTDDYLENDVSDELLHHWAKAEFRKEDVVLVAEKDEIIGFIAVWCDPEPLIDNLHVLPHWRSKNVGRKLMKEAAEELIRRDRSTAYLWVLEDNRRAIKFYEGLGGRCVERVN